MKKIYKMRGTADPCTASTSVRLLYYNALENTLENGKQLTDNEKTIMEEYPIIVDILGQTLFAKRDTILYLCRLAGYQPKNEKVSSSNYTFVQNANECIKEYSKPKAFCCVYIEGLNNYMHQMSGIILKEIRPLNKLAEAKMDYEDSYEEERY